MANVRVRDAHGWVVEHQCFVPTAAARRGIREGLPSSLSAFACALGKKSHHLLIYFSSYFPSYCTSASSSFFRVMLSTLLYCLKFTAWNYLLIKRNIAIFWLKSSPCQSLSCLLQKKKKKSWEGLVRTLFMSKQWQTVAFWPHLLMLLWGVLVQAVTPLPTWVENWL